MWHCYTWEHMNVRLREYSFKSVLLPLKSTLPAGITYTLHTLPRAPHHLCSCLSLLLWSLLFHHTVSFTFHIWKYFMYPYMILCKYKNSRSHKWEKILIYVVLRLTLLIWLLSLFAYIFSPMTYLHSSLWSLSFWKVEYGI